MIEEITCVECNGSGQGKKICRSTKNKCEYFEPCEKCNGDGTLNWLENVFGKNQNSVFFLRRAISEDGERK
jgi:DnaJ-class molecular chaperone